MGDEIKLILLLWALCQVLVHYIVHVIVVENNKVAVWVTNNIREAHCYEFRLYMDGVRKLQTVIILSMKAVNHGTQTNEAKKYFFHITNYSLMMWILSE